MEDLLLEAKSVIKRGERVLVTALTKRLAEELTNFYHSVGMKVRYLHSDIDTLERVEIIRDLRAGKFDILVGINLLREGLDIPEVSLVGILDADKEGFLRSERSLIQTIGRAARNDKGRVILYAYKKTKSIEKACSETKRRRDLQEKYNKSNGITPQTITKPISEGVIEAIRGSKGKKGKIEKKHLSSFDLKTLEKRISELRALMKQASRELRFEDAAKIRDEIKSLSEARLLL